ncbi:MAG TPA: sigma-70 family RNA polymerase sigma factor [Segetibacter sp.]|jgi:RNA polymerase sigma-70 factor (ECF subfamily)
MNSNSTQPEAFLIERCLNGDRKYQKALYELYAPKLFTICLRYTKNQMDAEDVLQEGFVKVFKHLSKFTGEGSFDGWVRRIFVNTAIEHLRRKKMQTMDCEIFENSINDKEPSALENLYKKDLIKTTGNLSKGYQTVFNLYAIEGFSHQQIAAKLGITESTSKSQFSRAKAILRTMVKGGTPVAAMEAAI